MANGDRGIFVRQQDTSLINTLRKIPQQLDILKASVLDRILGGRNQSTDLERTLSGQSRSVASVLGEEPMQIGLIEQLRGVTPRSGEFLIPPTEQVGQVAGRFAENNLIPQARTPFRTTAEVVSSIFDPIQASTGLGVGGVASVVQKSGGKVAAPFFSKLQQTVEAPNFPNKLSAQDARNFISKNVKPSERLWTGVDDFLAGKKNVTKEELQDFVNANKVNIEETVLSNNDFNTLTQQAEETFNRADGALREGQKLQAQGDTAGAARAFRRQEALVIQAERLDALSTNAAKNGTTKFGPDEASNLTLAGGTNYKELLLRLPQSFGRRTINFFAEKGHFDEPNILSHVRMNERISSNGERVLFIEELQSDWNLAGRQKGFKGSLKELTNSEIKEVGDLQALRFQRLLSADEKAKLGKLVTRQEANIPNAPLLRNWEEFTMKRVLKQAADDGFDRVAWINGQKTADRYDVSTVADKIRFTKNSDGSVNLQIQTKTGELENVTVKNHAELETSVGTGVANKVAKQWDEKTFRGRLEQLEKQEDKIVKRRDKFNFQDRKNREPLSLKKALISNEIRDIKEGRITTSLEGDGLRVGGQWAFNLYDKKIKNITNNLGKKFGASVDDINIAGGAGEQSIRVFVGKTPDTLDVIKARDAFVKSSKDTRRSAEIIEQLNKFEDSLKRGLRFEDAVNIHLSDASAKVLGGTLKRVGGNTKFQSIKLTPSMRKMARESGFPLFQVGAGAAGAGGAAAVLSQQER